MIDENLTYYEDHLPYSGGNLSVYPPRNALNQRTAIHYSGWPVSPKATLLQLTNENEPLIPEDPAVGRYLGLTCVDILGQMFADSLTLGVLHLNNRRATCAEINAGIIKWEQEQVHTDSEGPYQYEPPGIYGIGGRRSSGFFQLFNTDIYKDLYGDDGVFHTDARRQMYSIDGKVMELSTIHLNPLYAKFVLLMALATTKLKQNIPQLAELFPEKPRSTHRGQLRNGPSLANALIRILSQLGTTKGTLTLNEITRFYDLGEETSQALTESRSESIYRRLIEPGFIDDKTEPTILMLNPSTIESIRETDGLVLARGGAQIDSILALMNMGEVYTREQMLAMLDQALGVKYSGKVSSYLSYFVGTGYIRKEIGQNGEPIYALTSETRTSLRDQPLHVLKLARQMLEQIQAEFGSNQFNLVDLKEFIRVKLLEIGNKNPRTVDRLVYFYRDTDLLSEVSGQEIGDLAHKYSISELGKKALSQIRQALTNPYAFLKLHPDEELVVKDGQKTPLAEMPSIYRDSVETRHVSWANARCNDSKGFKKHHYKH